MKLPKTTRRYCPFCKKHTEHKITSNKRKTGNSLKRGSKYRARSRGLARGKGNLGRYSKPAVTKFKQTGSKTTKKTDLRYACKECNKKHTQKSGFRATKVEFQ
ncbi:MAG: 50S ribosomal protein L44e [Nanobdellota archaeon]